jgi:hypothetical protein
MSGVLPGVLFTISSHDCAEVHACQAGLCQEVLGSPHYPAPLWPSIPHLCGKVGLSSVQHLIQIHLPLHPVFPLEVL